MLEDFLVDIYNKSLTIEYLKKASFYSTIMHVHNMRDYWNEAEKHLDTIISDLNGTDTNIDELLRAGIERVQNSYGDRHLFSALIDTELIPVVSQYLENFIGINVSDGDWTLESAMTGFLTLKDKAGKYVHSPVDPMWESFLYVNNIYDPRIVRYNILGGGLGYLAYQLWQISEGEAEIYVYEPDPNIGAYADLYGVLSLIDSEKVHYITGDDADDIMMQFSEDIPGIKIVRTVSYWDDSKYTGPYSDDIRTRLSNEETFRAFELKWRSNFSRNIKYENFPISDLNSENFADEWLVVGSGPSLNDNESFIKDSVGKRTICVVNSAFRWFCRHDIKPDLCVACDPKDGLKSHIEGIEEESKNVPLIADIVTSNSFVELYKGRKHYIYSQSSAFVAEETGVKEDIWTFGGTVTSMALEAALRMGAKKVYLIGADLGYPGGDTFASGVSHEAEKCEVSEDTVISVDEKIIPTTFIFLDYKNAIEKQIDDNPEVEVINRSAHGAYISGAYCNKWWENLPDTNDFSDYQRFLDNLKTDSPILGWNKKYYIFRQIIGRIEASGMILSDTEKSVVSETYRSIYEDFKKELDYKVTLGVKVISNLTYIVTDEYTGDKNSVTRRVIDSAKAESKKKHNILIVNTGERFGGKKVAIHDFFEQRYRTDLEFSDKIYYENNVFPFFQLPKGMPDIRHYRAFLESMSQSVPGKIIKISEYSLFADMCSELLNIEAEYTDKKI